VSRNLKIVSLGYTNPGLVFWVPRYPSVDSGAFINAKLPYLGSDAALVAQALANWTRTDEITLLTNPLGDDDLGRAAESQLRALNIRTNMRLLPDVATPQEIDICDDHGTRTWFVESAWHVFGQIGAIDLSAIRSAGWLYLDWYVGDELVARALEAATNTRVYLNIEFDFSQTQRYAPMIARADVCQLSFTPDADPQPVIEWLRSMGAVRALITRGRAGCVAIDGDQIRHVVAPTTKVVATVGAGAIFSAAMLLALARDVSFFDAARIATHMASARCAEPLLAIPTWCE
jgi:sugar/nucleoside kinase (ribokinase family)